MGVLKLEGKNKNVEYPVRSDVCLLTGFFSVMRKLLRKRYIVGTPTNASHPLGWLRSNYFLHSAGRVGDHGIKSSQKLRSGSSRCFGISVSRYLK